MISNNLILNRKRAAQLDALGVLAEVANVLHDLLVLLLELLDAVIYDIIQFLEKLRAIKRHIVDFERGRRRRALSLGLEVLRFTLDLDDTQMDGLGWEVSVFSFKFQKNKV